jgi:hypothetical protein
MSNQKEDIRKKNIVLHWSAFCQVICFADTLRPIHFSVSLAKVICLCHKIVPFGTQSMRDS